MSQPLNYVRRFNKNGAVTTIVLLIFGNNLADANKQVSRKDSLDKEILPTRGKG